MHRGKLKAIILDDDPLFGSLMLRGASEHGVKATYVRRVQDLAGLDLEAFDMALVDFNLDGQSGIQVAQSKLSLPVVLMTSVPRWAAIELAAIKVVNLRAFIRKRRSPAKMWAEVLEALDETA